MGSIVISEMQKALESWCNEDSESRYVEILCGQNLRVCVRLFHINMDGDSDSLGCEKLADVESGELEDAVYKAIDIARGVLLRRADGRF